MSKCFTKGNSISIEVGRDYIKEYPWQNNGEVDLREGKWVMVHKEFSVIEITYNEVETIKYNMSSLKETAIDELVDCFRGWVQKVQILSMDNSKIKETRAIAK